MYNKPCAARDVKISIDKAGFSYIYYNIRGFFAIVYLQIGHKKPLVIQPEGLCREGRTRK